MVQYRVGITAKMFKAVLPALIIVALAVLLFGFGVLKVLLELASNFKIIAYVIAGIVALKILSLLGFKK